MPISFQQEKKKQKMMILVIAVVIVITAVVLYFGVFKDSGKSKVVNVRPANLIREISVDFNALENPIFTDLKPFELIPDFEGELGRDNPFLAY